MDSLDDLLGVESDMDRLASRNLEHEQEWLRELVALRVSKRMSQADVGELMGISQSGVARLEAGNRDLHVSSLRRYALAVGAEVHHIVNLHVARASVDISHYEASADPAETRTINEEWATVKVRT